MTIFWSIVAIMVLLSLFLIVRHLLIAKKIDTLVTDKPVLAIFKQRMQELEQDREDGLITEAQMQAAKLEMEQSLLEEVDLSAGDSQESALQTSPDWITAGIVTLLVPAIAISLYFYLGQPKIIDALRMADVHAGVPGHDSQAASINKMVESLAQRMQKNPNDVQGWTMLARSYKVLKRFDEAAKAFEHVYKLTGDTDVNIMLQYADSLAVANGGSMTGKPAELVQKALKLSPDNNMGLWLAGMAAREQGDNKTALDYFQRLLPKVQDDAESYQQVRQLIQATQKDLGIKVADNGDDTQAVQAPAPQTAAAVDNNKGIRVKVTLAPDLAGKVSPDESLFVFARATSGPPMPLAAAKLQVKDLPVDIVLNDGMAMMPSLKLSGYDSVQVNARISKSGQPVASSGDLVADAVPAKPGQEQPVDLVIKSVVP